MLETAPLKERHQMKEEEDTLPSRREKIPAGLDVFVCVVEPEIKGEKNEERGPEGSILLSVSSLGKC